MNQNKLSAELLKSLEPCYEGYKWYVKNCKSTQDTVDIIKMLIKENELDWANWVMSRTLSGENKVRYAIYAAEKVIGIFEEKYPDDKRPRLAIEASKNYLANPCHRTKASAAKAAKAAYAAADAADAAYAARAVYAAKAAYAASDASDAADATACSAYYTAADAAYNAAYAASDAASPAMLKKIIDYGLTLFDTGGMNHE